MYSLYVSGHGCIPATLGSLEAMQDTSMLPLVQCQYGGIVLPNGQRVRGILPAFRRTLPCRTTYALQLNQGFSFLVEFIEEFLGFTFGKLLVIGKGELLDEAVTAGVNVFACVGRYAHIHFHVDVVGVCILFNLIVAVVL